jgi:signal transduction histidine kinase
MDNSFSIFKVAVVFALFAILGYFMASFITSSFTLVFFIWIVFTLIVLFLYLSFYEILESINKKFKSIKSSQDKEDKILKNDTNISSNSASLDTTDFVSITAHEIKTPVSVIKGYTDLLLSDKDISKGVSSEAKEYIKRIESSSSQIFSLVENLLNITKIENGQMSLNFEKFDINDLIEEVLDNMENEASLKKIKISFSANKDLPQVIADRMKIEEVLNNFLSNAINYTPEKGEVNISAISDEKFVTVFVKDTGIGISYNDQKKIFSKFYRGDAVNVKKVGGNGLGLYISSKIIDMHKGKISVESEENNGSTFSFSLPINI